MSKLVGITIGTKNHLRPYIETFTTPDTIPVAIPPFDFSEEEIQTKEASEKLDNIAGQLSEKLDALVLSGGEDISPVNYGQNNLASFSCSTARDLTEVALVNAFTKKDKPILGICRGYQILGLMLGMSYFAQDLKEVKELHNGNEAELERNEPSHSVYVWGKFAEWMKEKGYSKDEEFVKMNVNSFHRQGFVFLPVSMKKVKEEKLSDFVQKFTKDTDLEIIASTQAAVEGFCHKTKPILSAQWHPEVYPRSILIKYFFEEYLFAKPTGD